MIDSDTDHSPAAAARRRLSSQAASAPSTSPQNTGQRDKVVPRDGSSPASTADIPARPERPAPQQESASSTTDTSASTARPGRSFALSNWFDQIHEPDWEAIGDRVMASPSTLAAAYRKNRERAKARAAAAQIESEAQRQKLIEAQAAAKAAQEIADALQAEARVKAEAQRAAAAAREAEQQAVARKQADIEAHRLAERQRLEQFTAQNVEAVFLRSQRDHDAELAREALAAHLPPPPTSRERLHAEVAAAQAAIEAHRQPVYVAPYELPSTAPNPPSTRADLVRRLVVSLVIALVAALGWGFFVMAPGTGASGERLMPAGSSWLSPAPGAQLIWLLIITWLLLFAGYQFLPSQRSALRGRAVGYPAAAALALAAGWMGCTLTGWILPAMLFAVAATAALYLALRGLNTHTARNRSERLLTDAPVVLFLGWMLVLAPASIAVWIASWAPAQWPGAELWAVLSLIAVSCLAASWAMTERGRAILALGFGWGMAWLIVARLLGPNASGWVALAAGLGAFVVLLATENRRYQIHHAEHRAARGQSTTF